MMNNFFRMPAEWEEQEAVFLAWPHNRATWPHQLEAVEQVYLQMIRALRGSVQAWLLVQNAQTEIEVRRKLTLFCVDVSHVHFFHVPTNDSWIRDYGPISVYDQQKQRVFVKFDFNGWGGKYGEFEGNYERDNEAGSQLAQILDQRTVNHSFILEGGSIDVNGQGTLITSESCLLNPNRNAQYTKNEIEKILYRAFGARHVIWVEQGIAGDDTDGHIDDFVRFVDPHTVLCAFEEDPKDVNYSPLLETWKFLRTQFNESGRPLRVLKLPMPDPVFYRGERLPASYANFLITNQVVLVPVFGCKKDSQALQIIQNCFPKRSVIGIDCRDVVWGLGSIHCLSQQVSL